MTATELRREGAALMAAIKAQIESGIQPTIPVAMLHWPFTLRTPNPNTRPGEWMRLPGFEDAAPLMDNGPSKTILFGGIRQLVAETRADGVIFASDGWQAAATREGMKHIEQWRAEVDRGFERLVKKGWAMRREAIIITAQSATDVINLTQCYRGKLARTQWIGDLVVHEITQAQFGGRQKMFGDMNADTLGEPPVDSYADMHNRGEL